MASDKIEYSRMLIKRTAQTGEVPTIPPVTAVTLNQMIPTDLFVGEFFLNETDDLLWIRTENGILPISLSGSTGSTPTLTQVLFEGNATNGYDIVVSSGDTIVFEGLNSGSTSTILGLDSSGNTITTSFAGTQDLQSVLTEGNTTGLNDIIVSSGASIIYEYLPTGSTNQYLALDADGRTIKTTASPSGDSLWTSGSSVGSVVTVAGSNTNTANYTLIAGESNTVSQTHSTGITSANIVIGKNNVVDGNSISVFGVNNSVSNSAYNIIQGASNIINGGLYNGIFGGGNIISGGSYNYILGGLSNKINPSGSNFGRSAIIGGSSNVIDGSGGLRNSVILGGQGITATTSNMTYVPNLTIVSATTGTSVASLGIDSTGKVITTSGGTSTTNTGTHFNSSLIAGYEYSLAITSNPQQIGIYSGAIVISPFTPGRNISISALTADIFSTAAGAEMKLVAYSNDPTRLGPGSIIIESPVFDLSVNPFTIRQYNVNYTFQAGTTYWLGIAANSAASGVQMRGMNISSTFAFGVPSVSGSGWIYNMCYSTISAWPSLPTPSSISPNWAPLPEVRIKVAS